MYIPLEPTGRVSDVSEMWKAPASLLQFEEGQEGQKGLLLFPIGASVGGIPSLAAGTSMNIEESLDEVLVEPGICSSVAVAETGNLTIVEMRGVKVKTGDTLYSRVLGSIPVSLAASVIAAVQSRPVIILDERIEHSRTIARYRVGI